MVIQETMVELLANVFREAGNFTDESAGHK
jgi:hypothetical protein